MSGQAGGRGYLVQALTSVLDALTNDQGWTAVALDPNLTSDKVDILWQYPTCRKVVQVKSSQNQINVPDAKKWCEDLEKSITADEYELRLIGPVSDGIPTLRKHGKVDIPTPRPLDPNGLVHQAAHQLDRYLRTRQFGMLPPDTREMMVDALVTRLSTFATQGHPIGREVFDGILRTWISGVAGTAAPPQQTPAPKRELKLRREEAEILTRLAESRTKTLHYRQADIPAEYLVLIDLEPLAALDDGERGLRYVEAVRRLRDHNLLVNHSGDGKVFHLTTAGRDGARQIRGKCLGCGRSMVNVGTDPAEPPVWECSNHRCIDSTWHRDAICPTCGKRPAEITGGTLSSTRFLCKDGHAFQTRPSRR